MKMKKFAILFCILCWTRLSMSEKCVTSSFNFLGPDSYINYLGTLPRLVEFSSCQYVQRNSIGHVIGVLRSYSTEKNPKAMLQFGKMTETGAEMHIHLLGNEKIIKEARRGKPYSEMLWCVVIDTREKTQTVFLDGRQISVIHFKKLDPIPGGGELLLGKSRDKTLPGYQGSMRNIMMWARKLTSNEIRVIYKSGFCPDDAIIKMHRGNVQLHGSFGAEKLECTSSSYYFPGTGGYLQYKGTLPDLTNFTMCQYMGTNSDGHTNGVLRGYSTTSNKNAMLFYGKKTSNRNIIDVHMGGKIQSFLIPLSLPRNKEIFACQNIDMVSKKARLYMSGMAIFTKKFDIQPPVPGGGILFIGNSPDINLPGYRGKVRNFMIWKRRLEDSEIADMFKSNLCPGDAIVTIHPESVEKHGDVIQYGKRTAKTFYFDGIKSHISCLGTLPELSQLTTCQYVEMNYKEYFLGVTQSYSTEDDPKTFLTYGQRTYTGADLHIHIGGQHWTTPIKFPSRTEVFICIVFDSESKTVQLYFNGGRTQTKTFDSLKKFPAGGKLQYGAISDESLPNYRGRMKNMMIWGRILRDEEIMGMHESNLYPDDAIVDIKLSNVQPHGIIMPTRTCIASDYVFSNSDGRVEYVEYIKTAPALETATFCMWLTTDSEGAIRGAIGSYTVGYNVDVNIAEGKIINGITSFALGAKGQFRTIPVSLRKNEEYQICLVGDFVFSNTVKTYVNGVFVTKIQFDKIGKMPGGGKIIIGQRQGCLGGCFDAAKAYKGRIRNFNIWTRMLSEEEIRNMVDSNQCPSDHVVDLGKGNAIFRRLKKEIVTQLPQQFYSIS